MQYLMVLMLFCSLHFHAVNIVVTEDFMVNLFGFFLSLSVEKSLPFNSLTVI